MARRRAEPGANRRDAILAAALNVFAEVGFDGATTKDIAAAADVTQGLLYFYFPAGKEELYLAAFEHQASLALDSFLVAHADPAEAPEAVLRRALTQFILEMSEPRGANLLRLMTRALVASDRPARDGERGRMHLREVMNGLTDQLAAYLAEQMARGALPARSAAIVADLIISSVCVVLVRRAKGDPRLASLSAGQIADELISLYLYGLLAPAPALPATPHATPATELAEV